MKARARRLSFVAVKRGMRKLSYWTVALSLLPLLWGVLHQTGLMLPDLMAEGVSSWWRYAAGAGLYLLVERIVAKPMWLYVVGHELTHALTGLMSGAKVHSFKAKSTGGEVRLSKSNAFIALSPYIVPLYALILIGLYAITRHWLNTPYLRPVFEFMLGIAVAFHISLTVSAIHKHQPDLKVLGHFLSAILIVLGNVLILALFAISLFSKTPRLSDYARDVAVDTGIAFKTTGRFTLLAVGQTYDWVKKQQWIQ